MQMPLPGKYWRFSSTSRCRYAARVLVENVSSSTITSHDVSSHSCPWLRQSISPNKLASCRSLRQPPQRPASSHPLLSSYRARRSCSDQSDITRPLLPGFLLHPLADSHPMILFRSKLTKALMPIQGIPNCSFGMTYPVPEKRRDLSPLAVVLSPTSWWVFLRYFT